MVAGGDLPRQLFLVAILNLWAMITAVAATTGTALKIKNLTPIDAGTTSRDSRLIDASKEQIPGDSATSTTRSMGQALINVSPTRVSR
jgi:hypothetical protein